MNKHCVTNHLQFEWMFWGMWMRLSVVGGGGLQIECGKGMLNIVYVPQKTCCIFPQNAVDCGTSTSVWLAAWLSVCGWGRRWVACSWGWLGWLGAVRVVYTTALQCGKAWRHERNEERKVDSHFIHKEAMQMTMMPDKWTHSFICSLSTQRHTQRDSEREKERVVEGERYPG